MSWKNAAHKSTIVDANSMKIADDAVSLILSNILHSNEIN